MIQSPPRRPSNVAAALVLGFLAGFAGEFAVDMALDFTLTLHSLSVLDTISFVVSLVLGLIVGGVMFIARPRSYGVAVLAGVSAVVSGILADEIATPVYFAIRHLPFSTDFFTAYFTHARPMFWVGNLCSFAVAAGLAALRTQRVRATEADSGGAPAPSWGPPPQPGPWTPQAPYGPPGNVPGGNGRYAPPPYHPRAPYNPPPQAPYEPPPQAPYGPPPRA